jgi:4-carboxymuconolactone decarboxylase
MPKRDVVTLEWLSPNQLDEQQVELYQSITGGKRADQRLTPLTDQDGRLYGPFNTLLHYPRDGSVMAHRGEEVRFGARMPKERRELTILYLAKRIDAPYEWYAHIQIARTLDIGADETDWLTGLVPGIAPELSTAPETIRPLAIACEELLTENRLCAESVEYFESMFAGAALEFMGFVGYYQELARVLRTFDYRIPEEDADELRQEFASR